MKQQSGSVKVILILIIGCVIAASVYWLRPKPKVRPPVKEQPPIVSVMSVAPQRYRAQVNTQGTVVPARQINLVAEVSGRVIEVSEDFANGGFFQKGEVLVALDDRDYQYRLIDAKAQVAAAERELALEKGQARQAKREWRDLGSKEANALSLREPQVKAAQAQLSSAIGQMQQAELNLQRSKIRSPFDGRIQSTNTDLGQYVSAGSVIAEIYDTTLAEVRVPLTDRQLAQAGLPLGISLTEAQQADVLLRAQVAGRLQEWPAKLVRMEANVDSKTRFHFGVVEVPEPFSLSRYSSPLVAGLFVEAVIQGVSFDQAIRVPEKAIFDKRYVFIVDENNQLQRRQVSVVDKQGTVFWVQGDLQKGDQLVVTDPRVLKAEMLVSPVLKDGQ